MTSSRNLSKGGDSEPTVRTAAIYARTSSPNQRYNHSIGEQIDQSWKHCDQRDWVVNYTFIDECIGGGTIDRPKFLLMLDKAKSGCFDVIVFWKLDRFCRSLVDLVNIERKLHEWDVNLCSVTEYIDTTTSVGRFNFRSLASVAEFERELIGERSRMGLYALAKKHKWPNAQTPLGYSRQENGKLLLEPKEADLVKRIFQSYLSLKSMPQVAYELNQDNIYTKKGKKWIPRAIRDILTNKIYIGEFNAVGVHDHVEEYRLLSDELYDQVTQVRLRFKNGAKNRVPMPQARRMATINKVFDHYHSILQSTTVQDGVLS